MGLIDLFQKTRETSMEMKPQEDEAAKVVTCKGCGAELKAYAYGKNLYVCPHCGRYGRLLARTRIRQIADKDSFEELYANLAPADPIHFPGYAEKTAELAEKVRRALAEMLFEGVVTATDYQMHILCSKAFVEANFNVNSIANGDFD